MDDFDDDPPAPPPAADFDDLLQAARRERCLSENTLLAYTRAWRRLFAWTGAGIDPAALTVPQAARFYREVIAAPGRSASSSQVQARAALAFAFDRWDKPNPFERIKAPKPGNPPPTGYLPAHDLARLLECLRRNQGVYGASLTYFLASTLFYTCSRYNEIARLRWTDCQLDGSGRPAGLRIKAKGGANLTLPVNAALGALLLDWRALQEQFRGVKIFAARGLAFCRSDFMFAGPSGEPFTNQAFNLRLRQACRELRLPIILSAHGLRHSAATILLNDHHKNLREVQEVLRHKDIRTTVRYTHLAPEHTRATFDLLAGSLTPSAGSGARPRVPRGLEAAPPRPDDLDANEGADEDQGDSDERP
jgi:integrase/recombinase XerD